MNPIKINEIKEFMVKKSPILYRGTEYQYITACIMRLNNNNWVYDLELLDKNKKAVVIAKIEDVEVKE